MAMVFDLGFGVDVCVCVCQHLHNITFELKSYLGKMTHSF